MAAVKDEWYVSRGGQRFGPVTFAEMVEAARAGRLQPRTDLVVRAGEDNWMPAGDIKGLFEKSEAPGSVVGQTGHAPPQGSMADSGSFDFNNKKQSQQKLKLPGAPRLGWFLGVTVLPVALTIGLSKAIPKLQGFAGEEFAAYVPWIMIVVPVLIVAITVKRFQNLAMSGWWFFGLFVPILNLWLQYRLFACPSGYGYTKKLDVIGKILAVLYWLSPVAAAALFIVFGAKAKELDDSGKLDGWMEKLEQLVPEMPEIPKGEEEGAR